MSLSLPDFQVRDVVDAAVTQMLANPKILDEMLGFRPQSERDSFRTALTNRKGKVRLGWSAEIPEDWSVLVTLAGTQKIAIIGDTASDPEEEPLAVRILAAGINGQDGAAITFTNAAPAVPNDVPVRGTLRIGSEYAIYRFDTGAFLLESRGILGSTATAHAIGTEIVFYTLTQRVGWPEQVTLRVDVLGSNPPFIMMLGRMLQAYLVAARDLFETQGFTLRGVETGDLAPRPPMFPAELFARTLVVTGLTALSLPEDLLTVTATDVTLTQDDAEVSGDGQANL